MELTKAWSWTMTSKKFGTTWTVGSPALRRRIAPRHICSNLSHFINFIPTSSHIVASRMASKAWRHVKPHRPQKKSATPLSQIFAPLAFLEALCLSLPSSLITSLLIYWIVHDPPRRAPFKAKFRALSKGLSPQTTHTRLGALPLLHRESIPHCRESACGILLISRTSVQNVCCQR